MTDAIRSLHTSVTTILRALKIAETELRVAHQELNFVPADIQTLRFVSRHDGCMLSDLADHLGVVPTTASSIVDRLVSRGLLQRDRPETNRRAISLHLTAQGTDAFARLEAEELATIRIMLDALPPADHDSFLSHMARIADKVSSKRSL